MCQYNLTMNIHHLHVGSETFKGIGVILFRVFKDKFINNESYDSWISSWVSKIPQHYNKVRT
jgi:hypothetical protein